MRHLGCHQGFFFEFFFAWVEKRKELVAVQVPSANCNHCTEERSYEVSEQIGKLPSGYRQTELVCEIDVAAASVPVETHGRRIHEGDSQPDREAIVEISDESNVREHEKESENAVGYDGPEFVVADVLLLLLGDLPS